MVWPSTPSTMHCPSRVTCTAPGATGSDTSSRSGIVNGTPSSRSPIRLLSERTVNSWSYSSSSRNQDACKPGSRLSFLRNFNAECRENGLGGRSAVVVERRTGKRGAGVAAANLSGS